MCSHDTDFSFEWEERKDEVPFKVHMLAGSIAGISEHTLLLPLDNLKTHLQTKSKSVGSAFREIKSNGFMSFYRGSAIIALGCIPSHALFFTNFEYMKKRLTGKENEIDIIGNMIVGGSATLFHDLIMTPCELIKQRSQILKNTGYLSIISRTYRKEGLLSFWRSFPINFLGSIPNGMVFVSANENLKNFYIRTFGSISMSGYFACAAISGIISATLTTPLDNIKTRLNVQQVHLESVVKTHQSFNYHSKGLQEEVFGYWHTLKRSFRKESVLSSRCKCRSIPSEKKIGLIKYPNSFCSAKIILKEEGPRGFFKGISMRVGTQSISSAISWCVYEYFKKMLTRNSTPF